MAGVEEPGDQGALGCRSLTSRGFWPSNYFSSRICNNIRSSQCFTIRCRNNLGCWCTATVVAGAIVQPTGVAITSALGTPTIDAAANVSNNRSGNNFSLGHRHNSRKRSCSFDGPSGHICFGICDYKRSC